MSDYSYSYPYSDDSQSPSPTYTSSDSYDSYGDSSQRSAGDVKKAVVPGTAVAPGTPNPIAAQRSCTDILFLIVFILFWCGFIVVIAFGYSKGDPQRLTHGFDSSGNVCGAKNPQLKGGIDMTDKPFLFYGDPFDPLAVQICVHACPTTLAISGVSPFTIDYSDVFCVPSYPRASASSSVPLSDIYTGVNAYGYGGCNNVTQCPCFFGYWTKDLFHRCIGDPSHPVNGTVVVTQAVESVTQKIMTDVFTSKYIILVCGFIAFVLAFAWLILLRLFAGCLVWSAIFLVIALACLAVAILWWETAMAYETYHNGSSNVNAVGVPSVYSNYVTLLIFAIIASFLLLVMVLLLLFFARRIKIAIEIVKVAAKAVGNIPSLIVLPAVIFIILGGFFALWISAWLYLASSGSPVYDGNGKFVGYQDDVAVRGLQIYHMFALLWSLAFALALNELIIAGAVAMWYFRGPDNKYLPRFPLLVSVGRALRYHLGSIALGSFVIAVIQGVRLVMKALAAQAKAKGNKCQAFCYNCIAYCLACIQSVVAFINRNAYVLIAIEGTSFCTSARNAASLLLSNAARLIALQYVTAFLLFLGKIFITSVVGIVALEWLRQTPDLSYWAFTFFLIVLMAYAISAGFMSVFEMAIDTTFVSFCVDETKFQGANTPPPLRELANTPSNTGCC